MNRPHTTRAWPRNESPAARALVLIDWVLRHQVGFTLGALAATVVFSWVAP